VLILAPARVFGSGRSPRTCGPRNPHCAFTLRAGGPASPKRARPLGPQVHAPAGPQLAPPPINWQQGKTVAHLHFVPLRLNRSRSSGQLF